jgi:hypothetical protein
MSERCGVVSLSVVSGTRRLTRSRRRRPLVGVVESLPVLS